MQNQKKRTVNFIYYDPYGTPVGTHSAKIDHHAELPTHHLKSLINIHLPYGYRITNNFIYPKTVNFQNKEFSDIYVAVQEHPIINY